MDCPILIIWMSSFSVIGASGAIFISFFDEIHVIRKRNSPIWEPRFAASHLGLFCLPMSHKKEPRLIWVNFFFSDLMALGGSNSCVDENRGLFTCYQKVEFRFCII